MIGITFVYNNEELELKYMECLPQIGHEVVMSPYCETAGYPECFVVNAVRHELSIGVNQSQRPGKTIITLGPR